LFDRGRLSGVIDFDLASPGPRAWDMGYAAYRFVPLTDPGNPDVRYPGLAAQRQRLAASCTAYGHADVARAT
jgi:aminoglycoside phosphotransferase (APT) family kinase protein